jgi:hypothetical protein
LIANAQRVRDWLDEREIETIFADGLDDAIIGLTRDPGSDVYRVVYDSARVVQILVNDQNMDFDDAMDYLEHNIVGSWVGKMTPVWTFLPSVVGED